MPSRRVLSSFLWPALILICLANVSIVQARGAKQRVPENPVADPDADHVKARNEWFFRGRVIRGKPSAEFRRRAYQALTSSTPSQTVTAGQTSGAYNLTVQPVGASFTGQ